MVRFLKLLGVFYSKNPETYVHVYVRVGVGVGVCVDLIAAIYNFLIASQAESC